LSEKGERAEADLDSNYDDRAPEDHEPGEPYSHGEVDSEDELNSVKEASSASVSERDEEAGVNPDTKSDAVSGDGLNNVSDTRGELLSGQDEAEATPFSELADDSPQENFESKLDANSTGVVVSGYVFGQRNAQDGDSVPGIDEKPSLPLIEQNKAEHSPLSDLDDDTCQESAASGQSLESSPSAPGGADVPKHFACGTKCL